MFACSLSSNFAALRDLFRTHVVRRSDDAIVSGHVRGIGCHGKSEVAEFSRSHR